MLHQSWRFFAVVLFAAVLNVVLLHQKANPHGPPEHEEVVLFYALFAISCDILTLKKSAVKTASCRGSRH